MIIILPGYIIEMTDVSIVYSMVCMIWTLVSLYIISFVLEVAVSDRLLRVNVSAPDNVNKRDCTSVSDDLMAG